MSSHSRRFIIHGRVQGVFFRESTRTEARRLGLAGHAHNLVDGTVEVLAVGEPGAIEALQCWLQTGPPMARVERVEAVAVENTIADLSGFTTG